MFRWAMMNISEPQQLRDTTLSWGHEQFQAVLSTFIDIRYLRGVLRGRKIPEKSPVYANHKRNDLNYLLTYFADLPCQVLVPVYFHYLHLYVVHI